MIDKLILISGEDYNKEVIEYGLVVIRNGVISVSIILLLGILENRLLESIIYVLCNFFISTKIGGYHAKAQIGCLILTIITWKIALTHPEYWINCNTQFLILLAGVCLILVWKNAPVLHPNKARFGEKITNRQRLESVGRLIAGYIVTFIFLKLNKQEYFGVMITSMIEIIISMLIGKAIYMKGMKETIVPKIL